MSAAQCFHFLFASLLGRGGSAGPGGSVIPEQTLPRGLVSSRHVGLGPHHVMKRPVPRRHQGLSVDLGVAAAVLKASAGLLPLACRAVHPSVSGPRLGTSSSEVLSPAREGCRLPRRLVGPASGDARAPAPSALQGPQVTRG